MEKLSLGSVCTETFWGQQELLDAYFQMQLLSNCIIGGFQDQADQQ
jgi:hypothetical protein